MNPILPIEHFVPDVEARQWGDGRMYLYGSYDISGNTFYCSNKYHVFSSEDLINWKDHGVSFKSTKEHSDIPWSEEAELFAPDCIYKDGVYYQYFCTSYGEEGVACSNKPYGPFKNAVPVKGANKDGIDPAVFIDDDGQAYYYWGQFKLRGARLKDNMAEIDENTLCKDIINEAEHGFHEGSSMRKRNGIYYLIYTDISRGHATCLSYATSNFPLGPFKKGGVIIDNILCDKETWNNHGSIAEFNGKWYIFYHRSSQGSLYNRRVCIEPIYFNEDGSIDEVEMTTQGVYSPINASENMEAYRACLLSGMVRTEVSSSDNKENRIYEYLSFISNKDFAVYKYLDFEAGVSTFEVCASSLTDGGKIEIRLDDLNGRVIGECEIKGTEGWQNWHRFSACIEEVKGIHAIYLIFRGPNGHLFNLRSFMFK